MKIDPWEAVEIKDYSHVFKEFGLEEFSLKEFRLDHYLFERNIVFAHRDFERIYDRIQRKKPFINITGIASSGFMHLGHKVVIDLFRFFKEKKGLNYLGICDIDAYTSRPKITMEDAKKYAFDNLLDALALGLIEKDVFIQSRMDSKYFEFTFELSKKITENMFKAIYGHLDVGKMSAVILQMADILHPQLEEYSGLMPSITGIAVEQDPHARLARDLSHRLAYKMFTPSFIYIKHQTGLKGGKMSSSTPESAIFLADDPEIAGKKVLNALTGGAETIEIQKKKGGKPEICKVYEILKFHYPDSEKVRKVYEDCKTGKLFCGECKSFCAEFIKSFLEKHQHKKKEMKDDALKIFKK